MLLARRLLGHSPMLVQRWTLVHHDVMAQKALGTCTCCSLQSKSSFKQKHPMVANQVEPETII
jgi:hypothetical protein